jgi:hypothetical protein
MLQRCPHCDKPIKPLRYGATFGPLAIRIIDAIERAGPGGITTPDLFRAVYENRNGATIDRLKSYIGSINAELSPNGFAIRIDRASDRISLRRRA